MASPFGLYVQLGFEHISDVEGLDHILFITTLAAAYQWQEWKRIIILVTAFTVGHSLTLALSAFDVLRIDADLVELLIPITIMITALSNILVKNSQRNHLINYLFALFFGLIHGMGFSNFFRALQSSDDSIVTPLFGFNIGLEIGQLLIVAIFFMLYFLLDKWIGIKHRDWRLVLSGIGAGAALMILVEQLI